MLRTILSGNFSFASIVTHIAVILFMIFLILPVHEFAHAGVAYLLGDRAVKYRDRLSLNPLKHIDIMGAICMLLFGFGWAKPVPIDPRNFKYPKLYMGLTALAGPVSNVLCGMLGGVVFAIIYHLAPAFFYTTAGSFVLTFLSYYISINATLAVFNLIPIPPLDGSKVLFIFLPDKAVNFFYRYQFIFTIVLYALLFSDVLDGLIGFVSTLLVNFMLILV